MIPNNIKLRHLKATFSKRTSCLICYTLCSLLYCYLRGAPVTFLENKYQIFSLKVFFPCAKGLCAESAHKQLHHHLQTYLPPRVINTAVRCWRYTNWCTNCLHNAKSGPRCTVQHFSSVRTHGVLNFQTIFLWCLVRHWTRQTVICCLEAAGGAGALPCTGTGCTRCHV